MSTTISKKVRLQFVGRRDALDAFYLRFAYRHMKNGIYYCGDGGLGKTWVLQKIIDDNKDDPIRIITPIIDFFDTQNHSVRGLQATIRSRLEATEAFRLYDEAIEQLEEARSKPEVHPSVIVSLAARADKVFIECCQNAIVGREVVLLFDTFERVQQRRVGRWLRQKFLPNVGDLIVAIAGRPEPAPARMPDNVVTYELKGLSLEAFAELVRGRLASASDEVIESIWQRTDGAPLMANLILDLSEPDREQFIAQLAQLEEDEKVQNVPELQLWLVRQFAEPSDRNRVIWAMAYLRRRFDVPMLKYVVERAGWFSPADYKGILDGLRELLYIKEYPHQQSHLLHDEVQRILRDHLLPEVDHLLPEEGERGFRDTLYDLVVNCYYTEAIQALGERPTDQDLARQLRAEQLGYILDHDPDAGLAKYESYRAEVEETHDYDFEELLWGEIREHLDAFGARGYEICRDRGRWLRRHSLFEEAEEHYRQMIELFETQRVDLHQALGFVLMRQGEIDEAQAEFGAGRRMVKEDDFETIATIENNLGQAARYAGQWDRALEHYARGFRAATMGRDLAGMVGIYINRGYLYSLQGQYSDAKRQCEQAIELLKQLPPTQENAERAIYAWMNLGTAYRHSGEYAVAASYYRRSLELARKNNNLEAICDALQHLGINEHLQGRALRREGRELTAACEHQLQAWQYLTEALEMARRSGWENALAEGLNRLGKVYREIYRLQQIVQDKEALKALRKLRKKALAYQMPLEVEYEYDLLTRERFAEADWLGKAARLFEVSALVADGVNNFHRALESWTEVARLFEELGLEDKISLVMNNIERVKGYDYQEKLFDTITQLILADLDFKQGNLDRALGRYKEAYADLAGQSGYAIYVLTDRLRDLEWRLRTLLPEVTLAWCDSLEEDWLERSALTRRPEMRDTLERIRFEAVERQTG